MATVISPTATTDTGIATTTQGAPLAAPARNERFAQLRHHPVRVALRRFVALLLGLLALGSISVAAAGTASATIVSWSDVGGSHDQNVSCDLYNHVIKVSPMAAPMWYYHNGQVVKTEFFIRDTRYTNWLSFPGVILAKRVPVTYLGDPILGSSGTEADWQYPMSSLGTFTYPGLAGHSYYVAVNYVYYNESRQVVRTDMHGTSSYSSGHWGYSGVTWIPTTSTVCSI